MKMLRPILGGLLAIASTPLLRSEEVTLLPEAVSRIYIQGNAGSPSIGNATPEGTEIYTRSLDNPTGVAVRGYIHYLRFDLSTLSNPSFQSATLTLNRVGGDGLSTGRVAIYGLLDLPGNTPQDWNTSSFPAGAETDFAMYYDNGGSGGDVAINLANVADFSADESISGNRVTLNPEALTTFLQNRAENGGLATLLLTMPSQGLNNNKSVSYASFTYADATLRPTLELVYFDASLPSPPENLRAESITFTADPVLELAWDAVPDAINYQLYRQAPGETELTLVSTQPGTTFVDADVELLQTYLYAVAVETDTGTSILSPEVEVAIADSSAPTPSRPAGLTLDSGEPASIALSWDVSSDTILYKLYRSIEPDRDFTLVSEVTEPSFTDTTGVTHYATYYYTVLAVGAGGLSAISEPLEVGPRFAASERRPQRVRHLAVTQRDPLAVTLTWRDSRDADAYYVYRSTRRDGDFRRVAVVTEPTVTDALAVFPEHDYYYEVAAVGLGGMSPASRPEKANALLTLQREMEDLDRGLVAVQTDAGVFVSWRWLVTDGPDARYVVFRNHRRIDFVRDDGPTSFLDPDGDADDVYAVQVIGRHDRDDRGHGRRDWRGRHRDTTPVLPQNYLPIPLQIPAGGTTIAGEDYTYSANDASVADLDGDGDYEFVVKWDPSNSKDNSQGGYTGPVYLDAYTLEGELMWRIDLGINIRAGAHYTQFMVYDFDGDGRAELICKTADGTTDAIGTVIGDPDADWRNDAGYILDGPEFLTAFDGLTGTIIDTVDYVPQRGDLSIWGDTYGNRVDRFLNGVAYFDGEHPSFFACRGQYRGQGGTDGRTVIAAFDLVEGELVQRWVLDSLEDGREWAGQGHHQLSVGDVDHDGKDEILYGGMVVDDDGTGLYSTELGTGDAFHYGDLDPTRPGREVFAAKEDAGRVVYRDAATGALIWEWLNFRDTGRGLSADINPSYPGEEVWGAANVNVWSAQGDVIGIDRPSINFAIWWDGDPLRELNDGTTIRKWDYVAENEVVILDAVGTASNNGSKATCAVQADLLGDWREEVVFRSADSSELRIYTTTDPTDLRIVTLMHDPIYRLAVAWQNNGYNQPPHPSFFIGANMQTPPLPDNVTVVRPDRRDRHDHD